MKPLKTVQFIDKSRVRSKIAESFERMGIQQKQIGPEKLQKQIMARGVKPEDNAFIEQHNLNATDALILRSALDIAEEVIFHRRAR